MQLTRFATCSAEPRVLYKGIQNLSQCWNDLATSRAEREVGGSEHLLRLQPHSRVAFSA